MQIPNVRSSPKGYVSSNSALSLIEQSTKKQNYSIKAFS